MDLSSVVFPAAYTSANTKYKKNKKLFMNYKSATAKIINTL